MTQTWASTLSKCEIKRPSAYFTRVDLLPSTASGKQLTKPRKLNALLANRYGFRHLRLGLKSDSKNVTLKTIGRKSGRPASIRKIFSSTGLSRARRPH